MPRGRPVNTRQHIVPPATVMTQAAVTAESWTLISLHAAIREGDQCLQWPANRRLIRNSNCCENCIVPDVVWLRRGSWQQSVMMPDVRHMCFRTSRVVLPHTSAYHPNRVDDVLLECYRIWWVEFTPLILWWIDAVFSKWGWEVRGEKIVWNWGFDANGQQIVVEINKTTSTKGAMEEDTEFLEGSSGGRDNAFSRKFPTELRWLCNADDAGVLPLFDTDPASSSTLLRFYCYFCCSLPILIEVSKLLIWCRYIVSCFVRVSREVMLRFLSSIYCFSVKPKIVAHCIFQSYRDMCSQGRLSIQTSGQPTTSDIIIPQ